MKEKDTIHEEGKKFGSLVGHVLDTLPFRKLLNMNRPKEFLSTFNQGIKKYIKGDWKTSGILLEKCLKLDPNDGPTKTIYEFLKGENFTSPNDWNGSRNLTSK